MSEIDKWKDIEKDGNIVLDLMKHKNGDNHGFD
jgi:hypothetical protein